MSIDWNQIIEHTLPIIAPVIIALGVLYVKIKEVHRIVNSQRTEMILKIERLEAMLARKDFKKEETNG